MCWVTWTSDLTSLILASSAAIGTVTAIGWGDCEDETDPTVPGTWKVLWSGLPFTFLPKSWLWGEMRAGFLNLFLPRLPSAAVLYSPPGGLVIRQARLIPASLLWRDVCAEDLPVIRAAPLLVVLVLPSPLAAPLRSLRLVDVESGVGMRDGMPCIQGHGLSYWTLPCSAPSAGSPGVLEAQGPWEGLGGEERAVMSV